MKNDNYDDECHYLPGKQDITFKKPPPCPSVDPGFQTFKQYFDKLRKKRIIHHNKNAAYVIFMMTINMVNIVER